MKTITITAWFIAQIVSPQDNGVVSHYFLQPKDNYHISYNSTNLDEYKEKTWYKLKVKAECEEVTTTETILTKKRLLLISKKSYICTALEVKHAKPNKNDCFYIDGICYY